MLELFFDDEKNFSVLEQILKSEDEKVNIAKIGFNLGVDIPNLFKIIQSLEFLDIIKIIDKTHIELNTDSRVLFALCIFDEIVGDYTLKKIANDGENKEENGSFQGLLSNVNMEEITVEELINMLVKQN